MDNIKIEYLSIDDVLLSDEEEDVQLPPVFSRGNSSPSTPTLGSPSRKLSTAHVKDLNEYIQKKGLVPAKYDIVDDPPFSGRFKGTICIEGWIEEKEIVAGPFGSKRAVREDLACAALQKLKDLESERGSFKENAANAPGSLSKSPRVVEVEFDDPLGDLSPRVIKSTAFVSELNTLCQKMGFPSPLYEIVPVGNTFKGSVRVPGVTKTMRTADGLFFRSKREVKEELAEFALNKVKQYKQSMQKSSPIPPTKSVCNAVGLLNTLFGELKLGIPTYIEYTYGDRFACEVTLQLDQARGMVFGDKSKQFTSKKAAKNHAAQEAWDWLETNQLHTAEAHRRKLRDDRTIEMPPVRIPRADITALVRFMGLREPDIDIIPSPAAQGIYDVAAAVKDFDGHLIISETVVNALGKTAAKRIIQERLVVKLLDELKRRDGKAVIAGTGEELTAACFKHTFLGT